MTLSVVRLPRPAVPLELEPIRAQHHTVVVDEAAVLVAEQCATAPTAAQLTCVTVTYGPHAVAAVATAAEATASGSCAQYLLKARSR